MREEKVELGMLIGWVLDGYVGSWIYDLIVSFLHLGMC